MFHKRIAQLTILAAICFIAQQTFFGMSILNRSTAIIITVFLFASLRTMQIKLLPRWVQSLDKCSMGIYIVHLLLLVIPPAVPSRKTWRRPLMVRQP